MAFSIAGNFGMVLSIVGFSDNVRLSDKDLRSVQLFILICSIAELSGRVF